MIRQVRAQANGFREKLVLWQRDGQLNALDFGGHETRNDSVLRLIDSATTQRQAADFGPVLIHTGDRPLNNTDPSWRSLAFCTATGYYDIAVPDFLFDRWPQVGIDDYERTAAALAQAGARPAQRNLLGWIGNCDTNPLRWHLHELGGEHPELMEIEHVSWVPNETGGLMETVGGNRLTLEQQVTRWALLIDAGAGGWSARLKLLLHSGRPVLMTPRPWQEWYWNELAPMVNFIPVKADLSDLVQQVKWALGHPQQATTIGQAGRQLAQRMLTRAAALDRWSEVLDDLSSPSRPSYAPATLRNQLDPVLRQLGA